MTWTRLTQSPVGVTAWPYELPDAEPKLRLGVGSNYAELTLDDAVSLGNYLLSHAPEKDDQ